MTLTRRRFLTVSAASIACPGVAAAHSWQGHAFGAEVALAIRGPRDQAEQAINDARALITQVERLFSIYDPASAVSRLNATGTLPDPAPRFTTLMQAADAAHILTDGLFDPTIQPLWTAIASGGDEAKAEAAIGWDRVQFYKDHVSLQAGQALTFNGIAQGFATDLITEALMSLGLTDVLVNIGEHRGIGGPWVLGLQDPTYGTLGTRTLTTGAIATSSPLATSLVDVGHILHPTVRPKWSSVSVEAPSATLADSLSTAMVLASRDQIEAIRDRSEITRVTLVDFNGDLTTL